MSRYKNSIPVTVRGVDYPSISAASRALGVSTSPLSRALAVGKQDNVGLSRPGAVGPRQPITIRGVTYKSMTAAARALGIPQTNLTTMRNRGTLDAAGLGTNHLRKIPVHFNGEPFDCIAALVRHLGRASAATHLHRRVRQAKEQGKTSLTYHGGIVSWPETVSDLRLVVGGYFWTRSGTRVGPILRDDDGFYAEEPLGGHYPVWKEDGSCDFFPSPADNRKHTRFDLIAIAPQIPKRQPNGQKRRNDDPRKVVKLARTRHCAVAADDALDPPCSLAGQRGEVGNEPVS